MCIIEYCRLEELRTQNMQTLLLGSPVFKLHNSVALRVNHDSITICLSLKKWQASTIMEAEPHICIQLPVKDTHAVSGIFKIQISGKEN